MKISFYQFNKIFSYNFQKIKNNFRNYSREVFFFVIARGNYSGFLSDEINLKAIKNIFLKKTSKSSESQEFLKRSLIIFFYRLKQLNLNTT